MNILKNNPYQSPQELDSLNVTQADPFKNSRTTLALIFVLTILGWIWIAIVMQLLMVGLHLRNSLGILAIGTVTTFVLIGLQKSMRRDAVRRGN